MKKIMLIILVIISILFTMLFIFSNNKDSSYEYFTILESKSYVYKEDRRIDFNVYCNKDDSLISYSDKNSYSLKLDDMLIPLNDVSIKKAVVDDYYLVRIDALMPNITNDELICKDAKLIILNSSFELTLNIGSFSILNPKKYELLSVQTLYASFSIIDSLKHLVGININLTNKYNTIDYFKIGGISYGMLSKIKYSTLYDDEVVISDIVKNYYMKLVEVQTSQIIKDNILFIPISYEMSYLLRGGYIIISLNNEKYYLDSFIYMLEIPSPNEYHALVSKGAINYDKLK